MKYHKLLTTPIMTIYVSTINAFIKRNLKGTQAHLHLPSILAYRFLYQKRNATHFQTQFTHSPIRWKTRKTHKH